MRSILLTLMLFLTLGASAAKLTVVIDAGHGGHDIGAPGATVNEKAVNLAVAKKLGSALKKKFKDDIKVIYTRDNDSFVKLGDRAEIANRADADLFVSIHCNSIGDRKRRNQVSGASVYVRGFASSQQASEVAALENAVLQLEDNTKIDLSAEESVLSDLKWNRNLDESIALASLLLDELVTTAQRRRGAVEQNDLAVLKRTRMPAVLVELDYICNSHCESFLASDAGQDDLAKALCNGIAAYTDSRMKKTAPKTQPRTTPKKTAATDSKSISDSDSNPTRYKVQFMTAGRIIAKGSPRFKGLGEVDHYKEDGIIKYTVGDFATAEEAATLLKKVKKLFPDAFVIRMQGRRRIR